MPFSSQSLIRYSAVWEDAEVLCQALAPVARGGRLLSICSAGDNVLALLTLDPAEVVAVDLNPAQLACLELRMAAFRRLEHPELLAFLGVTPCETRLRTYTALRADLGPAARGFWDGCPRAVAGGVIHAGRLERYLRAFRRLVLPLIHPAWKIERLRKPAMEAERRAFYDREWDTSRWRCLFRTFFSRAVMARFGRDPAFFREARGSPAGPLLQRTRHALVALPTHSNPYLAYILTGTYPPEARPLYLREEHWPAIRERLSRVRLREGAIEQAAEGPFDGFNLSDLFEYLGDETHEACYAALLDQARPGARLVYWNMGVPRACPLSQAGRVRPLDELARDLHARDQVWFYAALRVDEAG